MKQLERAIKLHMNFYGMKTINILVTEPNKINPELMPRIWRIRKELRSNIETLVNKKIRIKKENFHIVSQPFIDGIVFWKDKDKVKIKQYNPKRFPFIQITEIK
jgi:hypothetical protein